MTTSYRIAIVGASSLRGKELNEALAESSFALSDFLLMDEEGAVGRLESAGDEAGFIQQIAPDSFANIDFTFFAGAPEVTGERWQDAMRAGSSIVDLTYELEQKPGVLVCAPWVNEERFHEESSNKERFGGEGGDRGARTPNLHTPAVVAAHPGALTLAMLLGRIQRSGAIRNVSVTFLESASEFGRAALDELHRQTVSLLSFESLPKEFYDIQVAFNAIAAAGEGAKVNLAEREALIRRHYALLSGGRLPQLALQLVHVPVFHGHNLSIAIEFEDRTAFEHVEAALAGPHVEVILSDVDAPSNLTSAAQEDILVRLRSDEPEAAQSRRFWLWVSIDNLKLAALNAIECAQELRKLRPTGKVQ